MHTGATLAKEFAARWKAKNGRSLALPWARAGAFFKKRLREGDSAEEILAAVDFYFNRYSGAFATRRGFDFVGFHSSYNAVVAAMVDERRKAAAVTKTDENFTRLEEARRRNE